MSIAIAARQAQEALPSDRDRDEALGDLRFRALLSEADWAALPPAVRRRFRSAWRTGTPPSTSERRWKPG